MTASWSYCFDANGNRTFDSTSTAATVLCPGQSGGPAASYTYDGTNALTARAGQPSSAFAYDQNGAELAGVGAGTRTAATWNPRMQLTGLDVNGDEHTFAYAGEGNKERTAFDQAGYQNTALGITTQTGTNPNTVIREPDGTPVALRIGGVSHYYVADQQGSTISLVDAAGVHRNAYTYDPYGASRTRTEGVSNPYQYIAGHADTTGLYHLQNRYYDPTLGRFTQPDPSGQEINTYLYSSANPINVSDPTGLYGWSDFGGDVGAIGGGIAAGAIVGAACGATFGIACAVTSVFVGAAAGSAGGAFGTAVLGGSDEEIKDGAIGGAVSGGLAGPAGAATSRFASSLRNY